MADRIIELGLLEGDQPLGLIDRLLSILSEATLESDALRTKEFRTKLEVYRRQLAATAETSEGFGRSSAACLKLCEDYFARSRKYLLDREAEFAEVINVLREALGRLAGEANSFNDRLMSTSDRFERLSEIDDLRELRKQVSMEVRELKRIVDEKQRQDQASYSRLSKRVEVLQQSLERTQEEASMDGLTRVANRGSFDKALARWTAVHNDSKKSFILALFDLDNFKAINDTHGHLIGDRVLLCAAQRLSKCVRANDFLARYGGEEFVIMLTDLTAEQAEKKFSDLLARIAASSYDYKVGGSYTTISFTVSCGVAEFTPGLTGEELVKRADEALYEAKRTGKNRVVVSKSKKGKGLWSSLQPLVSFRS